MNPDWKKLLAELVEVVGEYEKNGMGTERQKELEWQAILGCYYAAKKALDENLET